MFFDFTLFCMNEMVKKKKKRGGGDKWYIDTEYRVENVHTRMFLKFILTSSINGKH